MTEREFFFFNFFLINCIIYNEKEFYKAEAYLTESVCLLITYFWCE